MQVLLRVVIGPARAIKSHKQLAEHVKSRHAGAAQGENPHELVAMRTGERQPKNLVLGKKSGEGREARDGEHGNEERGKSYRHPDLEPPHLTHVLLMVHGMNHAAGAEEETRFEKRMGHQMKNCRGVAADADADEHVSELADGG